MTERGETTVINIGGKGSSLTPAAVYAISTGQAQVRLDSSALDRPTSKSNQITPRFHIPKTLSSEETRASLIVSLNKLLLSNSVPKNIPIQLSEKLNSPILDIEGLDTTGDDFSDVLWGIGAILVNKCMALSIAEAVAALSCEALKADVSAFASMDSGDGFVNKDANGVAGDLKIMLTGSNLVGKVDVEAVNVIPRINGKFREVVKSVYSIMRVELNSAPKSGKGSVGEGGAIGMTMRATLLPLAVALLDLGKNSLCRAKLNMESIVVESLKNELLGMFAKGCPDEESVKNAYKLSIEADFNEDYVKFEQQVNVLCGIVRNVVNWEAVTAFFVLEGGELSELGKDSSQVNEGDVKVDNKNDKKKKKKKVAMGRGTSVITQFMKDILVSKGADSLEKWVESLLSLLNPDNQYFTTLLDRVKEIVECNEVRRLPKIPKGTRDFAKEQMTIREKAFSIITKVFKKHGGTSLDTPVFELRETLMGKYGEDSKLIYDLADQIKFNHRMLLDGMLEICGVPPEKFRTISSSIDKLDKQDFNQVKKEMVEEKGLSAEVADKIGLYVKERGHPLELLSKLKQDSYKFLENEASKKAFEELEILFECLDKAKCIDRVVFDLSLARGLDYYTGVIYEAVFKGATQTIRATETEVLVAILGDKTPAAAELCQELWASNLKVEFSVHKSIMKHIELAINSKIPWMLVLGEQELNQGIVKLKDLENKEEVVVQRVNILEELKTRLNK
ncbi:hypothetical protein ACFE04_016092 [Oxalis oulophora]